MYVLYACTKTEPQKLPEHTSEHVKAQNFLGACPQTPSYNLCYGPRILYLPWAPPILSAALFIADTSCLKTAKSSICHVGTQKMHLYSAREDPNLQTEIFKYHPETGYSKWHQKQL